MTLSYLSVLHRLYNLNLMGGGKLGLASMQKLDDALGNPAQKLQVVHIAGTNGKGTVGWKVATALHASGYRVGLFSSPHLSTFRERIRLNGRMVSEEQVTSGLERIFSACDDKKLSPTFFEAVTALAFLTMEEQCVDVAVVEVGLGGRLDSTNIVDPVVTAITSIGYDHCDILGDTLEAIATEKAGIVKPGVPLVIGPDVPAIVETIAASRQCGTVRVGGDDVDVANCAVAMAILDQLPAGQYEVPLQAREQGIASRPPCRYETFSVDGVDVILDVAHNAPALEALFVRLSRHYGEQPVHVVAAFSVGKDVASGLAVIEANAASVTVTKGNHPRIAVPAVPDPAACSVEPDVACAVRSAITAAQETGGLVVVCGSFFILAEALTAIGVAIDTDPFELNELATTNRLQKEVSKC